MNIRERKIIYALPFILLTAGIFIVSHQSKVDYPELGFEWQDKIYHALAYIVYGASIITMFTGIKDSMKKRTVIIFTLLIGILFGLSDELHQSYVPGRDASVEDWIADAIGIMLSISLINPIASIVKKIKRN